MDNLSISAASGLRARMESLEMLANNLANAATAGYKTDREFYSLYIAPEALDPAGGGVPTTAPVIERNWTDFSQGTLRRTENPLDVAISGPGFFAVNGPAGPLYTRNGSFSWSAAGTLVAAEGYPVRAAGGGTIQSLSSAVVEISAEGVVTQAGQVLGRVEIVDFADPGDLSKQGANYFRAADSGAAPHPARGFQVHQGKLEGSNVSAAEGAVRLVSVMRQFEMLQKAITLASEMNRRAVEEVARVGS